MLAAIDEQASGSLASIMRDWPPAGSTVVINTDIIPLDQ
jgi:hypothetical protein